MKSALFCSALVILLACSPSNSFSQSGELWKEGQGKESVVAGVDPEVFKVNRAMTVLAEKLSPSVVSISTKTRVQSPMMGPQEELFRFFFGNPFGDPRMRPESRETQSLGSGFVLNDKGYIITNSHVIRQGGRNADQIFAKFLGDAPNFQGWEAKVVGVDESSDVAVIKLKKLPSKIVPVVLGQSSNVKVGEMVVAIGNPLGHSHSVTSGIVSALGRSIDLETRTDFIQTDASINPGNSGGPLFNAYGEVIGINTAIDARAQGIGFAIPIDVAKNVVRQLIEKGQVDLGWIGIYMADVTPGIAEQLGLKEPSGVLIQEVIPGEPAAQAGLRSYDVVVGVNGTPILSGRDLVKAISNQSIGSMAKLDVIRDGEKIQLQVRIGKRKSDEELAKQESKLRKEQAQESKGMFLSELTDHQRRMVGLSEDEGGVLVQGVAQDSFARAAGVMPGDILLEVNRRPVKNVKDAVRLLNEKKKAFLLKLQRQNATIIILMET
jgi:Do/DeqQ family serine protease